MTRKLILNLSLLLLLIIFFASGCAVNRATATVDPTADLSTIKSMYVTRYAADDRGINLLITNKLKKMGYDVTTGVGKSSDVDVVVTYVDKWMWDITMYMLEINIEFRNPESEFVFATGKSYRTSLVREPPEVMIDEVLRDMFAGKIVLPEKKVKDNKGE